MLLHGDLLEVLLLVLKEGQMLGSHYLLLLHHVVVLLLAVIHGIQIHTTLRHLTNAARSVTRFFATTFLSL